MSDRARGGWIRLDRAVFEHDFFAIEPFTEREAWIWLIANAAWKDTLHRIGGKAQVVPRGSLVTTLRELQRIWQLTCPPRNPSP